MAWLDDRAWCHPKLVNLSDRAFRTYINAIAYSSGMGTRGTLTAAQQRLIGSTAAVRRQLIEVSLWDELPGGAISIHDWEEHNGRRDERRARDRERKRAERARRQERPQDSPQDSPAERRQERRALKEVKEVKEVKKPVPEPVPELQDAGAGAGAGDLSRIDPRVALSALDPGGAHA